MIFEKNSDFRHYYYSTEVIVFGASSNATPFPIVFQKTYFILVNMISEFRVNCTYFRRHYIVAFPTALK
jgi:hypothetical protein